MLSDPSNLIGPLEAGNIGIKEDNGFETGEFLVVDLDFSEGLHQLGDDPFSDLPYFVVLSKTKRYLKVKK